MNQDHLAKWQSLENRIISCGRCERLVAWREYVARTRKKAYREWEYWGKPVPGFGDYEGRILAIGLAPGAHGSNRTGRMFTGDSSGKFLYRILCQTGYANQPDSTRPGDGLVLNDLYISAVCRCAPPENKPSPNEISNCTNYLEEEISLLNNVQVVVALGKIAFEQTLSLVARSTGIQYKYPFVHGRCYDLPGSFSQLIASYHPSQQNTQTGRLTETMFKDIWLSAKKFLK